MAAKKQVIHGGVFVSVVLQAKTIIQDMKKNQFS
jgi:hypothetical protein